MIKGCFVLKFEFDHFPIAFAVLATAMSTMFGGWDGLLRAFVVFIVLDIITGAVKGIAENDFNSKRMRSGFTTKAGYLIVIIIAVELDRLMPDDMTSLRVIALWFYIFVEGSSILENLAQIGVPIPKMITDRLSVLQGKGGDSASVGKDGKFDSKE